MHNSGCMMHADDVADGDDYDADDDADDAM